MDWQTTTVEGDTMPMTAPIYEGEDGTLYTPARPGNIRALFELLDATKARRNEFDRCSTCGLLVEKDERGDVLDSSGRCDECRP